MQEELISQTNRMWQTYNRSTVRKICNNQVMYSTKFSKPPLTTNRACTNKSSFTKKINAFLDHNNISGNVCFKKYIKENTLIMKLK